MKKTNTDKLGTAKLAAQKKLWIMGAEKVHNRLHDEVNRDINRLDTSYRHEVNRIIDEINDGARPDDAKFIDAVKQYLHTDVSAALNAKHLICETPHGIATSIIVSRAAMTALSRIIDSEYQAIEDLQKQGGGK